MKHTRKIVISFRVDDDMKRRLKIRAMHKLIPLADYCYQHFYNDLYRRDKNKAIPIDSNASK